MNLNDIKIISNIKQSHVPLFKLASKYKQTVNEEDFVNELTNNLLFIKSNIISTNADGFNFIANNITQFQDIIIEKFLDIKLMFDFERIFIKAIETDELSAVSSYVLSLLMYDRRVFDRFMSNPPQKDYKHINDIVAKLIAFIDRTNDYEALKYNFMLLKTISRYVKACDIVKECDVHLIFEKSKDISLPFFPEFFSFFESFVSVSDLIKVPVESLELVCLAALKSNDIEIVKCNFQCLESLFSKKKDMTMHNNIDFFNSIVCYIDINQIDISRKAIKLLISICKSGSNTVKSIIESRVLVKLYNIYSNFFQNFNEKFFLDVITLLSQILIYSENSVQDIIPFLSVTNIYFIFNSATVSAKCVFVHFIRILAQVMDTNSFVRFINVDLLNNIISSEIIYVKEGHEDSSLLYDVLTILKISLSNLSFPSDFYSSIYHQLQNVKTGTRESEALLHEIEGYLLQKNQNG